MNKTQQAQEIVRLYTKGVIEWQEALDMAKEQDCQFEFQHEMIPYEDVMEQANLSPVGMDSDDDNCPAID